MQQMSCFSPSLSPVPSDSICISSPDGENFSRRSVRPDARNTSRMCASLYLYSGSRL